MSDSTSPTNKLQHLRTVFAELPRVEREWVRPLDPASYGTAHFLLLRGLGLIYLVAFFTLQQQLYGLISSEGLLPAGLFLEKARLYFGEDATPWLRLPTLFWFGASDAVLYLTCYVGLALSLSLLMGYAHALHFLPCGRSTYHLTV